MIQPILQPIKYNTGNVELKQKYIDPLDFIPPTEYSTGNCCKQSEFRIGCMNCRLSNIKNLKNYFKYKLEDMKLQTVDYKSHFKKPCFNCSSSFHGSSYEDGHFNIQKILKPVEKCDTCQRIYTTKRSFYHSCNICNVSFKNCKLLVRHRRREHNSNKPHQCAVCHVSLANGGISIHICKHTLPHVCPYCNKRYAAKINLKLHILRVCNPSSKKDFKCKLCPMEFHDKYKFKAHQNIHAKLFRCKLCDKCFSCRNGLKWHSYVHSGDWPYNCNFCNKGFPTQKTLSAHVISHTGKKPFSCIHCPNQYKLKHSLEVHLFEHTGVKQFKCDLCDKMFATQIMLNQHKRVHMKHSFQCIYCPKEYTSTRSLDTHLIAHTGGKKFKCDLCSKTFAKAYLLKRHDRIHMKNVEEKLFKCQFCPNQYKREVSLNLHLFEHTGGKQFKCDICNKTFAKPFLLNQHKLTHMEKSFQCMICLNFYKTRCYLNYHIKHTHKKSA